MLDGEFHGRSEIRDYIVKVMSPYPDMMFPQDWQVIDVPNQAVIFQVQNQFPHPHGPDGKPFQFPNLTRLVYAGGPDLLWKEEQGRVCACAARLRVRLALPRSLTVLFRAPLQTGTTQQRMPLWLSRSTIFSPRDFIHILTQSITLGMDESRREISVEGALEDEKQGKDVKKA
jgi:hypothetical protein